MGHPRRMLLEHAGRQARVARPSGRAEWDIRDVCFSRPSVEFFFVIVWVCIVFFRGLFGFVLGWFSHCAGLMAFRFCEAEQELSGTFVESFHCLDNVGGECLVRWNR